MIVLRKVKKMIYMWLVNKIFVGTRFFKLKRNLLNGIGYSIGEGTKVVGPIECTGILVIGSNCWIGKNLRVNGNGKVVIESNCDIAPEVTFQTGGHFIGDANRRAGEGRIFNQHVKKGTWICGRSTILGNTTIGEGVVVAGCSCVTKSTEDHVLVAGVPAVVKRHL